MKSGFVPADKASDELIAGAAGGGALLPEVEPEEGAAQEAQAGAERPRRSDR